MLKTVPQKGLLSILYSIGSNPLLLWDQKLKDGGEINKVVDEDISSSALEILGLNLMNNYITCPADPEKSLGITLPIIVLIVKNLNKYFAFEIQIIDDKNIRRRFRASSSISETRVQTLLCSMPMSLDSGWNQIQFNLADFVKRAYGTRYVETLRIQIHANCRIRRIYFANRLYSDDELPAEFKLFLPLR